MVAALGLRKSNRSVAVVSNGIQNTFNTLGQRKMLFRNDESYLLSKIITQLGYESESHAVDELNKYGVPSVKIGGATVYSGELLNAMIIRLSQTAKDATPSLKSIKAKNQPRKGGKFA